MFVRNSGAGNGCANFMGAWKNAFFLQEKPVSIKFLLLGGGGSFGFFWGGGGGADFIFMGARIFLISVRRPEHLLARDGSFMRPVASHLWQMCQKQLPDQVSKLQLLRSRPQRQLLRRSTDCHQGSNRQRRSAFVQESHREVIPEERGGAEPAGAAPPPAEAMMPMPVARPEAAPDIVPPRDARWSAARQGMAPPPLVKLHKRLARRGQSCSSFTPSTVVWAQRSLGAELVNFTFQRAFTASMTTLWRIAKFAKRLSLHHHVHGLRQSKLREISKMFQEYDRQPFGPILSFVGLLKCLF